jgi:hypothetical protein
MKNLKNFSQFEKLVELTIDAVVASGKPFNKIEKNEVLNFLKNTGLPVEYATKVYERVKQVLSSDESSKSQKVNKQTQKEQSESPNKTPRKSVFSEIKKITK